MSLSELQEMVKDGEAWCVAIQGVTNAIGFCSLQKKKKKGLLGWFSYFGSWLIELGGGWGLVKSLGRPHLLRVSDCVSDWTVLSLPPSG